MNRMKRSIRVLMITCGWPQPGQPQTTHFIKRQARFLGDAGIDVDVFPFRGQRNPVNYLGAWLRVRPRLSRARYDLVHAQFGQSGLLALPKRLPLVVTLRGSDILGIVGQEARHTRLGQLLPALSRAVVRRADAVVAVSDHMLAHIPAGTPVTVIPSGLDLELFRYTPRAEARRRVGLPLDRPLVLFAGNPALPRKRFDLTRRAMEVLCREHAAELVVAWGVPHSDIPLYMSACDALVFTSMQEGSPNVVKEALACGLPVVSVRVGDVAQRIGGVEGCELCEDEDPETIAAALARVLRRTARVDGLAAVRHLDERVLTARLIELYGEVLDRAAAPAARKPRRALEPVSSATA